MSIWYNRRIHNNGTLEILAAGAFEAETTTVRCRAGNPHGVALSRDVVLQAVSDAWEAVASARAAAPGAVAAVTCAARDPLVHAALWYRGDAVLHVDPPSPGILLLMYFTFNAYDLILINN